MDDTPGCLTETGVMVFYPLTDGTWMVTGYSQAEPVMGGMVLWIPQSQGPRWGRLWVVVGRLRIDWPVRSLRNQSGLRQLKRRAAQRNRYALGGSDPLPLRSNGGKRQTTHPPVSAPWNVVVSGHPKLGRLSQAVARGARRTTLGMSRTGRRVPRLSAAPLPPTGSRET